MVSQSEMEQGQETHVELSRKARKTRLAEYLGKNLGCELLRVIDDDELSCVVPAENLESVDERASCHSIKHTWLYFGVWLQRGVSHFQCGEVCLLTGSWDG